jgi:hypothetical protein
MPIGRRYNGTYLVGSLTDISLEHQSLLDLVKHSLGFMESSSVNTDVQTFGDGLVNSLGNVLGLEVDSDNLGTDSFSHSESSGDSIDRVNLGGTLEESPLDAAELFVSQILREDKEFVHQ